MSPGVRLGQLLAHLGFLGENQTGRTLWDIDDEQLLAVLYQHRSELVARLQSASGSPRSNRYRRPALGRLPKAPIL